MNDRPTLLLEHHLKELKLPIVKRKTSRAKSLLPRVKLRPHNRAY